MRRVPPLRHTRRLRRVPSLQHVRRAPPTRCVVQDLLGNAACEAVLVKVGGHLPLDDPLGRADALGIEAIQLHLSAPRTWRPPLARADAAALRADGRVAAVHAPYLVNPPSADPVVRTRSHDLLLATLDAAATVGAPGVVVHAGQAGPDGEVDVAVERWCEAIGEVDHEVAIWIENTAQGRAAPGRHLDDLVRLVDALRDASGGVPVGVCIDTCHAWAGDPACVDDPVAWVTSVRDALGGIDSLHVNDSAVEPGAGRDRHANLGAGTIPLDVHAAMVRASGAPHALLETPGYDETRAEDLATLRSWVTDGAPILEAPGGLAESG